jgi:UDP-N-acetyl-D-glucosamine dehydrogenase
MTSTNKLVCVQGLGFVGSAMAVAVALASNENKRPIYDVIGVDLPNNEGNKRVNSINEGVFPFATSDENLSKAIKQVSNQGNLKATTDSSIYANADIIIVDIHLDIHYLDDQPNLEFEDFKSAIRTIGKQVKKETLILIETTVPPGTCEKVVIPEIKKELDKRYIDIDDVYIAHSYERVMPGKDYLKSITDYWRVFAGYTEQASDMCEDFLSSIINIKEFPLTRLSSTTASETAKVMENTYRAVNIAFIDEWTKYAEEIGIDLFEVIEAIKQRPTHSNIRFPGLGVGGYCLTKDPTFAPASSSQLFGKNLAFPFASMAVKINHNMPLHVVNRLKSLLNQQLIGKRILVCGVSYRKDVSDTRFSPSEILVRKLIELKVIVTCHDPYVNYWEELAMNLSPSLPDPNNFDTIIFAVPHNEYQNLDLNKWGVQSVLIIDANMVFNDKKRNLARSIGLRIESIGRGNGL